MKNTCKDEKELDKAIADLSEAFVVYESVYTEIGMKFGAKIIHQLLLTGNVNKFEEEK